MELKGKKINFLGDSITEGVGVSDPQYMYVNMFAKKYGAEVRNYGISGTRIARQKTPSENPSFDLDFCKRALEMDPDADVVVVFGGTNDFGHGDAPFGSPSDRTEHTFYGACHVLMRTLIERFPTAEIVFMTPLHRLEEEQEGKQPLSAYVDALKEVARIYSMPVLDLYAMSGINPQVPVHLETYMPDGVHPNDRGAEVVANRLGQFLLAL
ncbi:MAG: SGNH/GDSL hydrolase family protein [Ruminococcaceae bacterium]|nr:SGNH/GDSL hydrolase family protein [Oscillospiraceae bacterium]